MQRLVELENLAFPQAKQASKLKILAFGEAYLYSSTYGIYCKLLTQQVHNSAQKSGANRPKLSTADVLGWEMGLQQYFAYNTIEGSNIKLT